MIGLLLEGSRQPWSGFQIVFFGEIHAGDQSAHQRVIRADGKDLRSQFEQGFQTVSSHACFRTEPQGLNVEITLLPHELNTFQDPGKGLQFQRQFADGGKLLGARHGLQRQRIKVGRTTRLILGIHEFLEFDKGLVHVHVKVRSQRVGF